MRDLYCSRFGADYADLLRDAGADPERTRVRLKMTCKSFRTCHWLCFAGDTFLNGLVINSKTTLHKRDSMSVLLQITSARLIGLPARVH